MASDLRDFAAGTEIEAAGFFPPRKSHSREPFQLKPRTSAINSRGARRRTQAVKRGFCSVAGGTRAGWESCTPSSADCTSLARWYRLLGDFSRQCKITPLRFEGRLAGSGVGDSRRIAELISNAVRPWKGGFPLA